MAGESAVCKYGLFYLGLWGNLDLRADISTRVFEPRRLNKHPHSAPTTDFGSMCSTRCVRVGTFDSRIMCPRLSSNGQALT